MTGRRSLRARAATLGPLLALLPALSVAACESSATDREQGMRELRAIEEDNRNRFSAPSWIFDRVGCDVCPGQCQLYDLNLIPIPELVREFRHHCVEHIRDNPSGFPLSPHWKQLQRLTCIAQRHGDRGKEALLALLDDEDGFRFCTAWMALDHGLTNGAVPAAVLDELSSRPGPLARYALARWTLWQNLGRPDASMRKNRQW